VNIIDRGLTPFLEYLNTFPNSNEVTMSMVKGPLAALGATLCDLWIPAGDKEIQLLSNDGFEVSKELYQRISLSFHSPLTDSFINGTTIVLQVSQALEKYPSLEVDREYWEDLIETYGDGDLVHVPIFSKGFPIGMYTFLSDQINEWTPDKYSRLAAVAAALALWMSHQKSGVLGFDYKSSSGLWLTPRQAEILKLVNEGRSNSAISAHLGFSESTVKQELQRITKRLHVNSRTDAVTKALELNLLRPTD
jgi:DNA-binding CsgD family transcriptional regulator